MFPSVNIEALHAAILAAFRARYVSPYYVEAYTRPGEKHPKPAVLIEFDGFTPTGTPDTGTNQLEVELRFVAHCVVKFGPTAELTSRTLGLDVAAFINLQKWGQPVHAAAVLTGAPGDYTPGDDGAEVFVVEWTHIAYLGVSSAPPAGVVPTQVLASYVPLVGIPHEPDYRQLTP